MNNNIKTLIELEQLLYNNGKEVDRVDEQKVRKIIFSTLREVLKERLYKFSIGSYYFDITPQRLSIIYDTPDTNIEISNFDVHFETTRQTEKRFYCVSPTKKGVYPENTKNIEITGNIFQYDNTICTEQYYLKLNTDDPTESIKKYLIIPDGYEVFEDPLLNDPTEIVLGKDINSKDLRTDISIFFNPTTTYPVTYDRIEHEFRSSEHFKPLDNYEKYLPSLTSKKELIRLIYSIIIEFYNEYNDKKV